MNQKILINSLILDQKLKKFINKNYVKKFLNGYIKFIIKTRWQKVQHMLIKKVNQLIINIILKIN